MGRDRRRRLPGGRRRDHGRPARAGRLTRRAPRRASHTAGLRARPRPTRDRARPSRRTDARGSVGRPGQRIGAADPTGSVGRLSSRACRRSRGPCGRPCGGRRRGPGRAGRGRP
ncbi:hypothetical protein B5P19_14550 [Clavibacter sepedonicus]|nr:hypothetical protein B5P19_14550 [Clavibacter sepedonicus]OQJ54934.1 hypothetical protein B5P20_13130 [Clavibacter sepedonicus]